MIVNFDSNKHSIYLEYENEDEMHCILDFVANYSTFSPKKGSYVFDYAQTPTARQYEITCSTHDSK